MRYWGVNWTTRVSQLLSIEVGFHGVSFHDQTIIVVTEVHISLHYVAVVDTAITTA